MGEGRLGLFMPHWRAIVPSLTTRLLRVVMTCASQAAILKRVQELCNVV